MMSLVSGLFLRAHRFLGSLRLLIPLCKQCPTGYDGKGGMKYFPVCARQNLLLSVVEECNSETC